MPTKYLQKATGIYHSIPEFETFVYDNFPSKAEFYSTMKKALVDNTCPTKRAELHDYTSFLIIETWLPVLKKDDDDLTEFEVYTSNSNSEIPLDKIFVGVTENLKEIKATNEDEECVEIEEFFKSLNMAEFTAVNLKDEVKELLGKYGKVNSMYLYNFTN
jgi:hypothetical protein